MAPLFDAPPIIPSLPKTDGKKQTPWKSARLFSAKKICKCCGNIFRPWIKKNPDGTIKSHMKESLWIKQKYCSISCSKKAENAMWLPETKQKVSQSMKEKGHRPSQRGGNGKLTLPQIQLLKALGPDWQAEYVFVTARPRPKGIPKNIKIDLANPEMKIAIELDGRSHALEKIRKSDKKQIQQLLHKGWSVLRLSNAKALSLCSTCKSRTTLLTTLREYLHITAI